MFPCLNVMALFGNRFFKVTLFFPFLFNLVVASVKSKNLLNIVALAAIQLFPPKMLCDTLCLMLGLEKQLLHSGVHG